MTQLNASAKARRKTPDHAATVHQTAEDAPAIDNPEPRRIESWPIAGLKQHYQQAALFHNLDGPDFDRLVESLRQEGLREPVLVTPVGTIIDGHQRVRAAEHLGWTEIRVWVRDDLADDQTAIDRLHIEANLGRRQLDPLDRVRLARRLLEIERGRQAADFSREERDEVRERLGKLVGYSGRHAQRLLNILSTPMPVQLAFSKGQLPVVQADKVSHLRWTKQKQIAREIEDGGDPAKVVAAHLPSRCRKVKPDKTYERILTELARGLDAIEGRVDQIRSVFGVEKDLQLLERFGRFHEDLALNFSRRDAERARLLQDYQAEFGIDLTAPVAECARLVQEFKAKSGYGDSIDEVEPVGT